MRRISCFVKAMICLMLYNGCSLAAHSDNLSHDTPLYRWESDNTVTYTVEGKHPPHPKHNPFAAARTDRDACSNSSRISFNAQTEYLVNTVKTQYIGAHDLNGDSFPDLVVLYHLAMMDIYLNAGDGTFYFQYSMVLPAPTAVANHALGWDINLDSHLDLLISSDSGTQDERGLLVMHGDGQGGFPTHAFYHSDYAMFRSQLIDLDDDGDLDFVPASQCTQAYDGGIFSWFLNDGAGVFSFNFQHIGPPGFFPMHLALLPDEQGYNYLLISGYDWFSWSGHLLIMDPASWSVIETITIPGFRTENIALGDINGDLHLDLVSTMSFAYNSILVMPGTDQLPEFGAAVVHELEATFGMITTANLIDEPAYDPPGISVDEIIVATLSLNGPLEQIAYVYRYTECDSFSAPLSVGDPGADWSGFDVETADLNLDGVPDLMTTMNYTNNPRDIAVFSALTPPVAMTPLSIYLQAAQILLVWEPLEHATTYQVYRCEHPYADSSEAELVSVQSGTTYSELITEAPQRFYFVVAVLAD